MFNAIIQLNCHNGHTLYLEPEFFCINFVSGSNNWLRGLNGLIDLSFASGSMTCNAKWLCSTV